MIPMLFSLCFSHANVFFYILICLSKKMHRCGLPPIGFWVIFLSQKEIKRRDMGDFVSSRWAGAHARVSGMHHASITSPMWKYHSISTSCGTRRLATAFRWKHINRPIVHKIWKSGLGQLSPDPLFGRAVNELG